MPRAARKTKAEIDPDSLWLCWMSGSAEVDGQNVSFHEGERLRGDSPAVQGVPQYFVPDGTPEGERPSVWSELVERAEADRPTAPDAGRPFHPIEGVKAFTEDVRTLNRAITVLVGPGQEKKQVTYQAGTVFDARSELCGVLPDAFEAADSHIQFTKRGRR